jgi:RING finger/CHY zinc finger protein 1
MTTDINNICEHYNRGCDLLFPCCETFFPCRFCHDDKMDSYETDPKKSHKADRKSIEQIKCRICSEVQDISSKCIKCESVLGSYFCNICKLLDLDDKGQFHCDKCGICRQGGSDNFEHCDKCGICNVLAEHECKIKLDGECPVCLEDMFSSINSTTKMRCGHWIHVNCLSEYGKYNYKCPLCSKSLHDLSEIDRYLEHQIDNNEMPEEYIDKKVNILCNECSAKSLVKMHFYGHKCSECLSYNTKLI